MTSILEGRDLVLGYARSTVVHGVSIAIEPSVLTVLIGPNGSGKSTVLRSLARLHPVAGGSINLDDDDTGALSSRAFAQRVTLLSQSRPQPSGLAVRDVVTFGRHPHRRRWSAMTTSDLSSIERAMTLTGLTDMADRPVDQLSGGELQRVWLASCLAQDTAVLLLDEPTNHLDLRYQVETLDLVRDLADQHGTAIGVVLHDLNQAAAVADRVVLLNHGRVHAVGAPADVLTSEHLSQVYGLGIDATCDPHTGRVNVTPRHKHHSRP